MVISTDPSVSRCHAAIMFDENNYYLYDNNSRYGTALLINRKIFLNNLNELAI